MTEKEMKKSLKIINKPNGFPIQEVIKAQNDVILYLINKTALLYEQLILKLESYEKYKKDLENENNSLKESLNQKQLDY